MPEQHSEHPKCQISVEVITYATTMLYFSLAEGGGLCASYARAMREQPPAQLPSALAPHLWQLAFADALFPSELQPPQECIPEQHSEHPKCQISVEIITYAARMHTRTAF